MIKPSRNSRGHKVRTFHRLRIENFLSIRSLNLRLDALNVLVGANGAGKTNLLKAFQFLGEVARQELAPAIEAMGGFDNLLYRGVDRNLSNVRIELTGTVTKYSSFEALDEYKLSFWRLGRTRRLPEHAVDVFQRVENLVFKRFQGRGRRITLRGGKATVSVTGDRPTNSDQTIQIQGSATGLGTLRRLSDAYGSPQWNAFAEVVEDLRLFDISVDKVRQPSLFEPHPRLESDASNLANFLIYLREKHEAQFSLICDDIKFVLPGFTRFEFTSIGGADSAVRLDIVEEGLSATTPLSRASYGTIRAIALFAMLHDPNPPKLTCLEEIDHGLHPHALDRIVDRLRNASQKTQVILATHSPALVNRFEPKELIVVERGEDSPGSIFIRPDVSLVRDLKQRTDYELGELWFSGALGGGLD